jgi:hypothetical protein
VALADYVERAKAWPQIADANKTQSTLVGFRAVYVFDRLSIQWAEQTMKQIDCQFEINADTKTLRSRFYFSV